MWEHEFIVTENIKGKDMIIGRDFMKLYNVVIKNGNDSIEIDKPNKPVTDMPGVPIENIKQAQENTASINPKVNIYRTC